MLPHRYVVALGEQIARAWGRTADDVVLTPLPLFHFNAISVCVVGTLLVGGRAAIVRKFSVSRFWPEVRRTGRRCCRCSARSRSSSPTPRTIPTRPGTGCGSARRRRCRPTPIASGASVSAARRSAAATASPRRRSSRCCPAGEMNKVGRGGQAERARVRGAHRRRRRRARSRPATIGEIVCRPTGPNLMFAGYWNRPGGDGRGAAEPLVPHRRPRPPRRRRLPLLRRPQEGLPAAAGREHLQLRDGAHRGRRTRRSPTSRCTRWRATRARTT